MRYNIDKILKYACEHQGEIARDSRWEWAKLCCALKFLGYDCSIFVALSWATPYDCEKKWRAEHNEESWGRYFDNDPDKARAAIVGMAREAWPESVMQTFRTDDAATDFAGFDVTEQQLPSAPLVQPMAAPQPRKDVLHIADNVVEALQYAVVESDLYSYMYNLFDGSAAVRDVFRLYRVGAEIATDVNGYDGFSSAFPLINAAGDVIDIVVMPYGDDGHRLKESDGVTPVTTWLAMEKKNDKRDGWCLFGEHLATPAVASVCIVESAKTALMGAIAVPGSVWLATMGKDKLTPQMLQGVKGKECKLFPDADAIDDWRARAEALRAAGFDVSLCGDYVQRHASGSRDDVADIVERAISGDDMEGNNNE